MSFKFLYLRNFRNYEEKEFHFHEKLNLIYGSNALGKTNLLEAIYLIATGRSFKTQSLKECIRNSASFFLLEAEINDGGASHNIKLHFNGQEKKLELNGTRYNTWNPLLGYLPIVIQAPQEEDLIGGTPNIRRRFMNLHLAQSDPIYIHHLSRFWRAMKQRNILLRTLPKEPIECWEIEMAQSAVYLYQSRHSLIQNLNPLLALHSHTIAGKKEDHHLLFNPSTSVHYLQQLAKNRRKEQELGITLAGPHRDDLSFFIDQKSAKLFASEGQKKTAIAALKLAEWDHLQQRTTISPLMAIDEFSTPFDLHRLQHFHHHLTNLSQVFITSPIPIPNLNFDNFIELDKILNNSQPNSYIKI